MPPTGFHGILGLLIAGKIKKNYKYTRLGVVWGSVMPDLDLIGSVLLFIFTGGNVETTIAFHRSVTHSLIVIMLIFLIAIIFRYLTSDKNNDYFQFLFGLVAGMLLHVILDMFYFSGVTLFWPIQPITEKTIIIPYTFDDLSPAYNSLAAKIIGTIDGYFEIVFYLVFIFLAKKLHTDNTLVLSLRNRKFIINNWLKKLNFFTFFLILQFIFFLVLAIISIQLIPFDRNTFIVLLYIPLTPVFILSGILPLLMRKTVYSLN